MTHPRFEHDSPALKAAASNIEKAIQAHRLDKAIDRVLKATDALLDIAEPDVVALRRGLGEWLHYT